MVSPIVTRYGPGPRPRGIAHRGFHPNGEENTMKAFLAAVELGADVIETDVHATSDGVAVTFHDPTALRVAGEDRRIEEMRFAQVQRLAVGGSEPVPALEELLDAVEVPVNIDLKSPASVAPTVNAILRTRAVSRVCVTSFDSTLGAIAAAQLTASTGIQPRRSPAAGPIALFRLLTGLELPGARRVLAPFAAMQIPERHRGLRLVTPRTVAAAHRAGCEVHVWTVDDPDDMRRLLGYGVDGIITNRIDLWNGVRS